MCLVVDANRNEGKGTHVSVHAYLMRGGNDGELSWPFKGTIHQPAQPAGRLAAPHQGSCGCLNVALLKTPTQGLCCRNRSTLLTAWKGSVHLIKRQLQEVLYTSSSVVMERRYSGKMTGILHTVDCYEPNWNEH